MKNKKIGQSVFVVMVFILAISFLIHQSSKTFESRDIKQVKIAGQSIKVELAITPAELARGLSGRKGLASDEGMLFTFNQPGRYPFWMKDMNFPIDIIWLDEDLKVIYIKKDARPELYPETYGPDDVPTKIGIGAEVGTKYVLEVVSGFSEKNNLKAGDRAEFLYK
ncbi:MAG TPA: DUF192 domain-containing protein [Candidatus Paceibacterota bacterium]|nr:DUF192 domain-containing protein [Candidatus Paceibacterota bacterium]